MKKDFELKNLKADLENFLDSDSGYATASKVVLSALALAGIVFVIATAPNVFQILGKHKRSRGYSKRKLKQTIYALKRRGFVEVVQEKDGKIKVELTNKGKKRVKEFSIDNIRITEPKKWDKKWRVVIFDVPNRFTKARNALREKLTDLGFHQVQKSVWVHPYECEDEILFIANLFGVERFIEILTVESFLHEDKIRRRFEL